MPVLSARGSELESSRAYSIVRQLFERVVADAGPAARDELLRGAAVHTQRFELFAIEIGARHPDELWSWSATARRHTYRNSAPTPAFQARAYVICVR